MSSHSYVLGSRNRNGITSPDELSQGAPKTRVLMELKYYGIDNANDSPIFSWNTLNNPVDTRIIGNSTKHTQYVHTNFTYNIL